MEIKTNIIRHFLQKRLNDREIDDFCHDYFIDVYQEFSQGMSKMQKVHLLLDYCVRREQLSRLLKHLQKEYPVLYARYFEKETDQHVTEIRGNALKGIRIGELSLFGCLIRDLAIGTTVFIAFVLVINIFRTTDIAATLFSPIATLVAAPPEPTNTPESPTPIPSPESATIFPELVPITSDNAPDITQYGDNLGVGTFFNTMSYSHDGSLLAVATYIGIYIYESDALDKEYVQYIPTEATARQIAFSPVQDILAYKVDNKLELWDVTNNEALTWPEDAALPQIHDLAFNADGSLGITGPDSVTLWQVEEDGELLAEIGTESQSRISFSNDGTLLGVAHDSGLVEVWHIASCINKDEACTPVQSFQVEGDETEADEVAFSDQGLLASSSSDHKVYVWDISDCSHLEDDCGTAFDPLVDEEMDTVNEIVFVPGTNQLVSGSSNGRIQVWQQEGENWTVAVSERQGGSIQELIFAPDSQALTAGISFVGIKRWSTLPDSTLTDYPRIHLPPLGMRLYPDDKTVLLGSWDKLVAQLSLVDGIMQIIDSPTNVGSVALMPDGTMFTARCSCVNGLTLWHKDNVNVPIKLDVESIGKVYSMDFSSDNSQLVLGADSGNWYVWKTFTENAPYLIQSQQETTSPIKSIAFAPNNSHLAAGHDDGLVRLWDAGNGELRATTLDGFDEEVTSVKFSPDGRWLVAGSRSGAMRLWQVNGAEISKEAELTQHKGRIDVLDFSPDSSLLVSGSDDDTIKIWDVNNRSLEKTLIDHTHDVTGVAFSSDGRFIVSSSWDGTIRIWGVHEE